jgi:hypothetical protein
MVTTNPFVQSHNYATFSEQTNHAETLIKFVTPPFSGTSTGAVLVATSGFDTVGAGNYGLNQSPEDWLVVSNSVAVVGDPSAYNGTQVLALGRGTITRKFGTSPGQLYQLVFRTRTHPGDTNALPLRLLAGGLPDRDVAPTADWVTQVTSFLASSNSMSFTLQSRSTRADTNLVAFGFDLDGVELTQLDAQVRYLPEESLLPLAGGKGFGNWQLEITDARGEIVGDLVSWQLHLTFAPTNPAVVRLTNSVAYHGTNLGGPSYFFIDVPSEATVSVNQLTALNGVVGLFYSSSGLPDAGLQPGDVNLIPGVASPNAAAASLTTTLPPILPSGQRYYLEVVSRPGTATNEFVIQVDFNVPFTRLTNDVAVTRTNIPAGTEDYFYVDIPAQARGVTFEVLNPTGDVDLYVSAAPQLPRPQSHDYASQNADLADESIAIDGLTQPVPLKAGRWNLGVHNPGTNAVTYTVLVHEDLTALLALTNGVPFKAVGSVAGNVDYYYLDITNDVISGQFEIRNATGDVDLYLRRDISLPTASSFDYASTNGGRTNELIFLNANDGVVPMQAGRWILGALVKGTGPVNYEVVATAVYPPAGLVELFENVPDIRTGVSPGRTDYRFPVFNPTRGVQFELYDLDGPADLFVARGTLPRVAVAQFSGVNPGSASEFIFVSSNDVANFVADWYLTVERPAGGATHWTVKARTLDSGIPDHGSAVTGRLIPPAVPGGPFDYEWNVVTLGQSYQVQCTTNLVGSPVPWIDFGAPIVANQATLKVTLPVFTDVQRYYRVRVNTNAP